MNKPLKITAVGNSAAVILPKEVMARLRVEKGDELFVVETPNGIELRPHNPDFEAKMRIAREIMREDRDILRALAQ